MNNVQSHQALEQTSQFKLPFLVLTTNLIIRPLVGQDQATIAEAVKTSLRTLHMWLPWADDKPMVNDYIKITQKFYAEAASGEAYHFVVFHNEKFLGMCSLIVRDQAHGKADLGYWCTSISDKEVNFLEAINALIRYGFEQGGITEITIPCIVGNYINELAAKELNFKLQTIELINNRQIKMFKINSVEKLPELSIHWVMDGNNPQ